MRKVHIISTGEYSDWTCHAAFTEQPGKDFVALCQQFHSELTAAVGQYEYGNYGQWNESAAKWLLAKSRDLGLNITLDSWDKFGHNSDLYERTLAAWLVREHGYEQLGVHDTEISLYKPPSKGWKHDDDIAWP